MRFRYKYMILGTLLVSFILLLSDPDLGLIENLSFGAGFVATIVILTKTVLYASIWHITRKGLFDYIDFEDIYKKSMDSSTGAGSFAIALAVMMLAVSVLIFAATS